MATRRINLTPEADPILESLAKDCGGDPGFALSELLLTRESIEGFIDGLEADNAADLIRQRDAAARSFDVGDGISWDRIKRENEL